MGYGAGLRSNVVTKVTIITNRIEGRNVHAAVVFETPAPFRSRGFDFLFGKLKDQYDADFQNYILGKFFQTPLVFLTL